MRVRLGAGIGGLARAERRTVRSVEYARDPHLHDAPIRETVGEGIVSAMATPLVVEGNVAGCLYVGNRVPTAFTDTDAKLFEELAGHAATSLRQAQLTEHRLEVIRGQERERLAHAVHDSVVRSLMEIGFEAQEGLHGADDPGVRQRLASIGHAAEACLEALREQVSVMAGDRPLEKDVSLGEVTERLRIVHRRTGVERTFELRGAEPWSELPERAARTLTRIGQEALVNAELHSECTREHVVIQLTDEHVELAITDDGRGCGAEEPGEGAGHFGIRGMRAAAMEVGGTVRLERGEAGGVVVRARLPLGRVA